MKVRIKGYTQTEAKLTLVGGTDFNTLSVTLNADPVEGRQLATKRRPRILDLATNRAPDARRIAQWRLLPVWFVPPHPPSPARGWARRLGAMSRLSKRSRNATFKTSDQSPQHKRSS